ncbi:MAG: DNA polymerase III subunit alpha [Candidatus Saccharibacteria bacterium]|nr:DNA polymerase III subunit alpha [Candidatus Saccharibacteria bacterium]
MAEEVQLKASDFVHLHNHTHYSLLDGLTKVDELVGLVKETGMEAVAVTDHGTMSGLIELYKMAKDAGVKPILGLEAYVAARNLEDRDPAYDKERFHITLLAQTNQGFENLCRMMTIAETDGKYYKPRIDHRVMEEYNEGVICLSGCAGSEISMAIRNDDLDRARELIKWYSGVFKDRFYLEMQDHGHPDSPTHWDVQNKINNQLMEFSKEFNLPLVVTCDAHYIKHEDTDAHEVLLCIGTGARITDEKRMTLKDFQLHVITPDELLPRWQKTCPEAILNTKKIADSCDVTIDLGRILIPKFPIDTGETEKEYLDKMVFRGLAERYGYLSKEEAWTKEVAEIRPLLSKEILERIDYELSVVDKMGYNGYFLIVQDFINWGKNQGIIYGPGRGSAAGSLLAYAIHITDLDPLKYDLLFERFLNPDRISMPDIDTDIQDNRRDEVIEYCTRKYGKGRVGNIVTFGKMMAKNAVRDVARVLDVPYAEADRIAKLVPDPVMGHHVKLKDAIVNEPDLKREYETNPTVKEVIDLAMRLEGTIRSHGVHACGVVIAPDDLVKYLPMEVSAKGPLTTQYPGPQVEELGLLKMDFLGLSNLSVIQQALRIIKKVHGKTIDMNKVPLDDDKVYELFRRGDTTGVFQFESAGMKRYLRELQPTEFDDLIAMNALYRPGPMQFIESFIKRKHGEEPITYLHPGLENSLKSTYGILIYQEQFMQASKEWCGFTGGQADTLRKAVGKKKIDLMNKVKPEFIKGAVEIGGATEEIAETFWSQLLEFANYCFNKSHAACYALVAYWTAYLKAYYPDAFMAALMTADMRWTDRLAIEMTECKHMGIQVLGPDINESYADFATVGKEKKVRFGLAAIKGMGKALAEEVIEEREKNGPFKSICDFAKRVNATKFNKKSWESAIKTGAFDSFGDRSDLLFNLDKVQAYGNKMQKDAASGQTDLFGMMGAAAEIPEVEIQPAPTKFTDKEMLMWERDLMGLYISAHPLDKYDTYFQEQTMPTNEIKPNLDGASVIVGGLITGVRTLITKSGSKMAFVKIEDKVGEIEITVFPRTFEEVGAKLITDTVVKVSGKVNARDRDGNLTDEAKINAEEITVVTDEELETYESTGATLKTPTKGVAPQKPRGKTAATSVGGGGGGGGGYRRSSEKPANQFKTSESEINAQPVKPKKLFVRVEDSSDTKALMGLKKICGTYLGLSEVILVIGPDKKAMRMPFRVEIEDVLLSGLREIFGDENVVAK